MATGNKLIEIVGWTTDIAVLSLNGIVYSESIKLAGNTFDTDIIKYIKNKYTLLIGEVTAEQVKIKIGTVSSKEKEKKMEVRGRDLLSGLPKTITVTSNEIKEAIKDSTEMIVHAAKLVLEKIEPELAEDIIDKGIVLTGGGALLDGLDKLIEKEIKVPTKVAESPLTCVAEGTGIILDNLI